MCPGSFDKQMSLRAAARHWLSLHRQILTQIIRLKIREGNRRGEKKKKTERERKEKCLFVWRVAKVTAWSPSPSAAAGAPRRTRSLRTRPVSAVRRARPLPFQSARLT